MQSWGGKIAEDVTLKRLCREKDLPVAIGEIVVPQVRQKNTSLNIKKTHENIHQTQRAKMIQNASCAKA